jgi:uncharacterized protein DUF4224
VTGYDEILTADEVSAITGRKHRSEQTKWLTEKRWRYELNASQDPVIGRWYARMKLAGVDISVMAPGKLPDFGSIR